MNKLLLSLLFLILTSSCGKKVYNGKSVEPIVIKKNILSIGSEWSRKFVNVRDLSQYNSIEQRTFKAVVKINTPALSGTAFYLGQHSGEFLFATNHHVLPVASLCSNKTMITLVNGDVAYCKKILVSWSSEEITLFTVRANEKEVKTLENTEALEFDFTNNTKKNDKFLSAGYGVQNNPFSIMTYVNDEFCTQVSKSFDYRKVEDYVEAITSLKIKRYKKKTWSFMHGCEGSHGDSGSPIVNRDSGKVVGIYWGGKVPKGDRFANDEYVRKSIRRNRKSVIWKKFNMGVPAKYIYRKIANHLKSNNSMETLKREILSSLINN